MLKSFRSCLVSLGVVAAVWTGTGSTEAALVLTSRTSDYTVSFSDLTFSSSAVVYKISDIYSGNAGDTSSYTFNTKSLATGVYAMSSGTISLQNFTITNSTTSSYSLTANATGSGVVTQGYQVAAGTDFNQSWVVGGVTNGLHSLEFQGDGFETQTGFPLDVKIHLAGNWTSGGNGPGQIKFLGVLDPGWSYGPLTYDSGTNTTLVQASVQNYTGGNGNIDFLLNGTAVVPEPASFAMIAIGCGLAAASSTRKASKRPSA